MSFTLCRLALLSIVVEGDVFDGRAMQLIVWPWVAILLTLTLAYSYPDYQDWSDQMRTYRRRRDTEADLNGVDFSRAARQALRLRRRPSRAAPADAEKEEEHSSAVGEKEALAEEGEQAPYLLALQQRRRRRRREDKELSYYANQARLYADYPQQAWRQQQTGLRRRRAWGNSEMVGRGGGMRSGGMALDQMQKRVEGFGGQQMEEHEEGMEQKPEQKRRNEEVGADLSQGVVRNVRAPETESDSRRRPGGSSIHEEQWRSPQERGFASFEGGARSPVAQTRRRRWWGTNSETGGSVRSPRGWFSGNRKVGETEIEEGRGIESRNIKSGYQDPYGAARYQSASADDDFPGNRGSRAAQQARGASNFQDAVKQQQPELEQRVPLQHVDQAAGSEPRHKVAGEGKNRGADVEMQLIPQYESEPRGQQESQGWEEEYPEEREMERGIGAPIAWEEQKQLAKEACIQKRMSAGEGGYGVACEPAGYLEEYGEEAEEPIQKRGYILPDLEEVEYGEPVHKLSVEEAKPLLQERGKRDFYFQPESSRVLRRVHRKLPEQYMYPERRRRFISRGRAQDADELLTKGGFSLRNIRLHHRRQVQSAAGGRRTARLIDRAHKLKMERQQRYQQQQKHQQQQQQLQQQEHQQLQSKNEEPLQEPGIQRAPFVKDNWMIGDLQMEGDPEAEQEGEAKEAAEEERVGRREYGDDKRHIFSSASRTAHLDSTVRFWMILLTVITTLSTLFVSCVPVLLPYS